MRHISDRIAVMYLGKIVELAPADELYDHPRHPYTGRAARRRADRRPAARRPKTRQVLDGRRARRRPRRPPGCRFHTRCPRAQAVCGHDEPPLETKDGGNLAACHFPLSSEDVAKTVPTAAG